MIASTAWSTAYHTAQKINICAFFTWWLLFYCHYSYCYYNCCPFFRFYYNCSCCYYCCFVSTSTVIGGTIAAATIVMRLRVCVCVFFYVWAIYLFSYFYIVHTICWLIYSNYDLQGSFVLCDENVFFSSYFSLKLPINTANRVKRIARIDGGNNEPASVASMHNEDVTCSLVNIDKRTKINRFRFHAKRFGIFSTRWQRNIEHE